MWCLKRFYEGLYEPQRRVKIFFSLSVIGTVRVNIVKNVDRQGERKKSSTLAPLFLYFYPRLYFTCSVQLTLIPRNRSSRPKVFCKKCVLWNFAKFTGKHLVSFSIKLQVFYLTHYSPVLPQQTISLQMF